jgi:hypothetical protein
MRDKQVAVLMVSLREVEPRIWRRFRVPVAIRLDQLHWAIQAVMGWEGVHDYEFEIGGHRYVLKPDTGESGELPVSDVRRATLAKIGPRRDVPFQYVYDQGDNWQHDVVLEALDWEDTEALVCTAGAMACPPEDGGGASAYVAALKAHNLSGNGKQHPKEEVVRGPLDPDFDPQAFSPSAATHVLRLMASAGALGDYE